MYINKVQGDIDLLNDGSLVVEAKVKQARMETVLLWKMTL